MQQLNNDPLQSKTARIPEATKINAYNTYDQSKQTYPKQTVNTTLYTGVPLNYNYRTDNRKILESSGVVNTSVTNAPRNTPTMTGEFYRTYSSRTASTKPWYTSYNSSENSKYSQATENKPSQTTENKPSQTAYAGNSYASYTSSYTNTAKSYSQPANLSANTSTSGKSLYSPSSYTAANNASVKSGENALANVTNTTTLPKTTHQNSQQSYSINTSGSYLQSATSNIGNSSENAYRIGQTITGQTKSDSGVMKSETGARSYSYNSYSMPKPVQKTDNMTSLEENRTRTAIVPTCNITLSSTLDTNKPVASNLYTNPNSGATNRLYDKYIPKVSYDVSNLLTAQKNTFTSTSTPVSREERPSSSYEQKCKPQSFTDLNGIAPKPLYSPTTYSYQRYTNNSITQLSYNPPIQQTQPNNANTNQAKSLQSDSYQSKISKPEDQIGLVLNEGETGEKINKVPTSPIALKRANSPNIRESIIVQELISTPSKTEQANYEENETFKPPSRTSPKTEKHPHHKTPEGRNSFPEKSSAFCNTLNNASKTKLEAIVSPGNSKTSETTPKHPTIKKVSPSLNDLELASEAKRTGYQSDNLTQNISKTPSAIDKKSAGQIGISSIDFSKVFSKNSSSLSAGQQANNTETNGIKPSHTKSASSQLQSHVTPLKSTDSKTESVSASANLTAINVLASKYVKTQKVDLIISPPSKLTSNERSTYSATVRTEEDLPSSTNSHFKPVDIRSQHMETENSGKKEPKSNQKPLAITFLKNVFNRGTDDPNRHKCTCDGYLKTGETCKRALKWILRRYKESEFEYLEETYQTILQHDLEDDSCIRQIKKDLLRTYPKSKYYSGDGEGIQVLERVLNAFAKYDPQIGYVQGMNFIAASLLYHAEEYLAFWLIVFVVESFEMRDIFLPKLPGLTKHCQIIDILIASHLSAVYELLCRTEIRVEMFCSEWIFSLFAGVVPLDVMGQFYDRLLEQGWPFFYKVILAFLQRFQTEILEQSEFTELMMILKSQNHLINGFAENKSKLIDWNKLFKLALKIEVDSNFIYSMHSNFDVDNQSFKTTFLTEDVKQKK